MPGSPPAPPSLPRPVLSLAVTGHRAGNPLFAANQARIAAVIESLFDRMASAAGAAPVRLHGLMADGADQLAARAALARGWQLVAPLPFGRALNTAINAHPATAEDARRLLDGKTADDAATAGRAAELAALCDAARLMELAEADAEMAALFLAMLEAPGDVAAAQRYATSASRRVGLAGQILIEQADIVLAVWDGASRAAPGGTGHTLVAALTAGTMVVLIDAAQPEDWRLLDTVEALDLPPQTAGREAALAAAVQAALSQDAGAADALAAQQWRAQSNPLFHGYRRVEALFGGSRPLRRLRLRHERPDEIATGSGAPMLAALSALPAGDPALPTAVARGIMARFAWADGIANRFTDQYRGGMVGNFVASAAAVLAGIAYLPFAGPDDKWLFALAEFLLLSTIVIITLLARRGHWHHRWFEARRAAEYLRQAPVLLGLGVARPPARWPRGAGSNWPEQHARHAMREVGLPAQAITPAWLRAVLATVLRPHVDGQRRYHEAKAERLEAIHHRLDLLSVRSFELAVVAVASWLRIWGGGQLGLVPGAWSAQLAKLFTFFGVMFPTLGGAAAGIRYFGDFDRFAAISRVSAERLAGIQRRADLLLAACNAALDYGAVGDLARAADEMVVAEIEAWQAVFVGKHFSVPV